ncbi:metal-sensing transcriptional repressor [Candidatus Poribacteria bacterium]|nr:metal-sensing transcriptional repressor [Candidatus Poribacteria bacterium]
MPQDHRHDHKKTQQVARRLARIEGHVRSIRQMVEEQRDCSEVLIQVSAVRAALEAVGRLLLEDHFESCIVSAIQEGDHHEAIEEFKQAFSKLVY